MNIEKLIENSYAKTFLAEFKEGDVVGTVMNERGVIAAVMTENFGFPAADGEGDENIINIEASPDNPAYVVGLGGESFVSRADALVKSNFEDGPKNVEEGDIIETVDHINFDETDLPEGWDRKSLVDWWASIGGTWEDAVDELRKEPDFIGQGINPEELASDWKTQLLGTDRWRNRF